MLLARLAGTNVDSFQQAADGFGFAKRPTPTGTFFHQSFPVFRKNALPEAETSRSNAGTGRILKNTL
ncbi:MAG: hypothetical protein LBK73_16410 [Treponema sp.]|jgi:hypothetical protein|nr:hypothetical protein [Treponema sp.]